MRLIRLTTLVLIISMLATAAPVYAESAPSTVCNSVVLMDADTNQVLYGKNMHETKYPASITKVMTGMLALERGNLSDTLVMSYDAVFSVPRGAAHIALDTDEEISLNDALYAMGVESANDAANGVAEYVSGSMEAFAGLMNERALELGALNTHFVNASGLEDNDHYTTAYDMALIMSQAIKTKGFNDFYSVYQYTMNPTNLQEDYRYFHNSNSFFKGKFEYDGIIASKTGWTPSSKHTLVTAATRNGRTLIAVVMDCSANDDKYEDTMKLLDYGFEHFDTIQMPGDFLPETLNVTKSGISMAHVDTNSFGTLDLLVHDSYTAADVAVDYHLAEPDDVGNLVLYINVRLKEDSSLMHEAIGDYALTTKTEPLAALTDLRDIAAHGEISGSFGQKALFVLKIVFGTLTGIALLLFLVVMTVRMVRVHQICRRKLAAKREKARWAAQQFGGGEHRL